MPNFFSSPMSVAALAAMRMPWPMSPNMTANRNGNVMTVNSPGLISWYEPMPYASMIDWKPSVNLFVRWNVGGFLAARSSCRMPDTLVPASSCSQMRQWGLVNESWTNDARRPA